MPILFLADSLVGFVVAVIRTLVPPAAEPDIARAVHEQKNVPDNGKEESKTSLDSMLLNAGLVELVSNVELSVRPWCSVTGSVAEFSTVLESADSWKLWPETDHSTVSASVAMHRTSEVPAPSSVLLVTLLLTAGGMIRDNYTDVSNRTLF